MISKKGVSTVIATVLIIMLTISAVAIFASVILPWAKNSLDKSTECIDTRDYFKFSESFGLNCKDEEYVAFSIGATSERKKSEQIAGFVLVAYSSNGVSRSLEVKEGNSVNNRIKMFDTTQQRYAIPKQGEVLSYIYKGEIGIIRIDVLPILNNGRICEVTDSIKIENCETGVISNEKKW